MRLYSLTGADSVSSAGERYAAGADGSFDFPEPLGIFLHGSAVGGRKQWETDIERQHRLIAEEAARRADPATLLAAVEQLVTQAAAPAAARPRARKTPPGK